MISRFALCLGLAALAAPSVALDIKVTRSLPDTGIIETNGSEQMEINFNDGSLVLVGSDAQAELSTLDGVLADIRLIRGVFEISTAPGGFIRIAADQCVAEIINGTLRIAVAPQVSDFALQRGSAALIRKEGEVANITNPGFSVSVPCSGDGAVGDVKRIPPEVQAATDAALGLADVLAMVDLVKETGQTRNQERKTNVAYKDPLKNILFPVSISPGTATSGSDPLLPPVSISWVLPGVGGDNDVIGGGGGGGGFFWGDHNPGPGLGGVKTTFKITPRPANRMPAPGRQNPNPGQTGKTDPKSIALDPTLSGPTLLISDIYTGGTQGSTSGIDLGLDGPARMAAAIGISDEESIQIDATTRTKLKFTSDLALTRLPVNGIPQDFITLTFQGQRYALLAGSHTAEGDVSTASGTNVFTLTSYRAFRLSPGIVQPLSGFVQGYGVDQAAGQYVSIASAMLAIDPVTTRAGTTPKQFDVGISADLDLTLDGAALSTIGFFGSAQSDTGQYFDLATQTTTGTRLTLTSGQSVAGLKPPASVAKYGSYLDWGILNGAIKSGGKTIDLLPAAWVAGVEWSPKDLDGFKGTARYTGHTLGNAIDQTGARTVFGTYDNAWDFKTGTGTVNMDFDGTAYAGTTQRLPGTVAFNGAVSATNRTGTLTGKFFGNSTAGVAPDAVGGTFSILGTTGAPYGAEGILVGKKQ